MIPRTTTITSFEAIHQRSPHLHKMTKILVPGTVIMPYLTWPLLGYPIRRLFRYYTYFLPFTDDIRSCRRFTLQSGSEFLQCGEMWIPWDYSAFIITPLSCCSEVLMRPKMGLHKNRSKSRSKGLL